MTLKQIKTRTKAVNASLAEMDFSPGEMIDFWQECMDEVNRSSFSLKRTLNHQVKNLTSTQ